MNIEIIKSIVNDNLDYKKERILEIIAEDKDSIPYLLNLLEIERNGKKEVIKELNHELSRVDVLLTSKKEFFLDKKDFIIKEIAKFYQKYSGKWGVFHCYKNN